MSRSHPHNSLPPETVIRKYVLKQVLGTGGFGITYLALDTELDRQVAVKELLPKDFATRDRDGVSVVAHSPAQQINLDWARKRFLEEARILAGLHHESILPIYDYFPAHGTAYLVTAYIDGGNFDEWLQRYGVLQEEELKRFALAILGALKLVHSRNVLHRDMKPGNILMEQATGNPILIDFGNARSMSSMGGTVIVTRGYAPFEQHLTKSPQGPGTDIYALGAVLYKAITGREPEDSLDRSENDQHVPLVRQAIRGFSRDFLSSIDVAMAFSKEGRWRSCTDWARVLEASGGGGGRGWRKIAALSGLGAGLIAFSAWALYHGLSDNQSSHREVVLADSPPPRNDGSKTTQHPPESSLKGEAGIPGSSPPPPPEKETGVEKIMEMEFRHVPMLGERAGHILYVSVFETRNRDWRKWPDSTTVEGDLDEPVRKVGYSRMVQFCSWMSRETGQTIRLPDDNEWSHAADLDEDLLGKLSPKEKMERSTDIFPWGEDYLPGSRFKPEGNYGTLDGVAFDVYPNIAPVGRFRANRFGLYDMGGNVSECCSTIFSTDTDADPGCITARGGSWDTSWTSDLRRTTEPFRSGWRQRLGANEPNALYGFRCVLIK